MTNPEVRWMSCSQESDWATAQYRHLTKVFSDGWATTSCGATGAPGAFRGNTSKAKCPNCVKEDNNDES